MGIKVITGSGNQTTRVLNIGDIVLFDRALVGQNSEWDKHETINFAEKHGIYVSKHVYYPDGLYVKSKWRVRRFGCSERGVVCGVRTIALSGDYDSESGYTPIKKLQVLLVAINMSGFVRVPFEFVQTSIPGGYKHE